MLDMTPSTVLGELAEVTIAHLGKRSELGGVEDFALSSRWNSVKRERMQATFDSYDVGPSLLRRADCSCPCIGVGCAYCLLDVAWSCSSVSEI